MMVQRSAIRLFMLIFAMDSAVVVLTCGGSESRRPPIYIDCFNEVSNMLLTCDGSESWRPDIYIDFCNEFWNMCGNT